MRCARQNLIILLALLLALPFLPRAFHLDEPNFLMLARQALQDPLGLYDFTLNWGGTEERAFDILSNPPGGPWVLALLLWIGGESETWLHFGFLPFLALALMGLSRLERRFCPELAERGVVTGWAAGAPALVLSAHAVMPDLPLLACLSLGLALAIEGLDSDHPTRALVGAGLAGCAGLFRYSGILVIPILLVYCLRHRSSRGIRVGVMAVAALPSLAWLGLSLAVYGQAHLLAMVGFQGASSSPGGSLHRLLYQLSSLGWALLPAWGLALLFGEKLRDGPERLGVWFGAGLGGLVGLAAGLLTTTAWQSRAIPVLLAMGMACGGALVGATVAVLSIWGCRMLASLLRHGRMRAGSRLDPESVFLACWLGGVLVFNLNLRFASVRYLLPALPAALLLAGRTLQVGSPSGATSSGAGSSSRRSRAVLGPTIATWFFSLALAVGDADYANAVRAYVRRLPASASTRFFVGHWGLQYYLEAQGAQALDEGGDTRPRPGDELIVPVWPWPQTVPTGLQVEPLETETMSSSWPFRTFTVEGGGCFYADVLSPGPTPVLLPFGFSMQPLEQISRYRIREAAESGALLRAPAAAAVP